MHQYTTQAIVVAYRANHAQPFVDMLNPSSVEDSRLVKVLAMPSKLVENLIDKSAPYALAAGHVRALYAVGVLEPRHDL